MVVNSGLYKYILISVFIFFYFGHSFWGKFLYTRRKDLIFDPFGP